MQFEKMKSGYMLMSIPLEMLEEAGISEESIIQMRAANGKILIEAVEYDDFYDYVCDNDCEGCPCSQWCKERRIR